MMRDLLLAFALVLIIEGILPALKPDAWRRAVEQISQMPDRSIRIGGVFLVLVGAFMFHLVR